MTKNIRNLALATMSWFRHKTVDLPVWEGASVLLREPSADAGLRWLEACKSRD
ncbi:phage tail assembly chaperone, partial [Escherichia coli]|uniref:phage tail assembly chaperone n=1 Tax=Escherichia coli TaxID=562 RepID=UPI001270B581